MTNTRIEQNRRDWIHELETTDLPQARYELCNGFGYCCIGIQQRMVKGENLTLSYCDWRNDMGIDDRAWEFEQEVIRWNDRDKLSFVEIAAKLREVWSIDD